MKKTFCWFICVFMLMTLLSACGTDATTITEPSENAGGALISGSDADATDSTGYEYLFRDIAEPVYITPADDFAGGDGTEEDPFRIADAAQLVLLHEKMIVATSGSTVDYAAAHYVLTADIFLNDTQDADTWNQTAPAYAFTPIGQTAGAFEGVFDGQGHTIAGLYINTNCGSPEQSVRHNYGLFDTVSGTIRNVNIADSYISVSGYSCSVGAVAGRLTNEAEVSNCTVNAVIDNYDATCGGVVGTAVGGFYTHYKDNTLYEAYSRINNCTFSGIINQVKEDAILYIGGIVGSSQAKIDTCTSTGVINLKDNVDAAGGIAGVQRDGSVTNSQHNGILQGNVAEESLLIAGGIVGKIFVSSIGGEQEMSRGVTLSSCVNNGIVSGNLYAGGIVGEISVDNNTYCTTISNCTNNGNVTGGRYTGGIIGRMYCKAAYADNEHIVVENCYNKADIHANTVGGIIGQFNSERGTVTVTACVNDGTLVSADQHCGGMIAYWMMNSEPDHCKVTISECVNNGALQSSLSAGGIVSFMDRPIGQGRAAGSGLYIDHCSNFAEITVTSLNGYVGGILGNWGMKDIDTVLSACTNEGNLYIDAPTDGMEDEEAEMMTVSRIAGGIVGRVGAGLLLTVDNDKADADNVQREDGVLQIQGCSNSGTLTVTDADAKNITDFFGGIIGNTSAEDGYSVYVDACTDTGFEKQIGNAE